MQTLHRDTTTRHIDRQTDKADKLVTLYEGTRYQTVSLTFNPLGYTVKRIRVQGEHYEIFE